MKKPETKQQKQLADLLLIELNDVFLKMGLKTIEGKMVTIQKIWVSQNLFEVRVFLNVFPFNSVKTVLEKIKEQEREIKKLLVNNIRNKVRSIPQLDFFIDDSVEHMFKMEKLFKKISKNDDVQSS